MSGRPTTQMQMADWDPENPNPAKKPKIGENWSRIGLNLAFICILMAVCIFISVGFCQHEQTKLAISNEIKHNSALNASLDSIKARSQCGKLLILVTFRILSKSTLTVIEFYFNFTIN